MSDMNCRVCGEPWDTYHIRHDAPAWVAPLFFAGAGCESCEGVAPEGTDSEALALASDTTLVIDSVTDEDPLSVRPALAGYAPPRWARPVNPTVWECECGVCVVRNLDEREGHDRAFYIKTPPRTSYYQKLNLRISRHNEFASLSDATDEISHDGKRCKLCAYPCGSCRSIIADEESYPDPADEYYGDRLCENCYCEAEYECAIESFSVRDLIEGLGYGRDTYVWSWFDNRDVASVHEMIRAAAIECGAAELERDRMIYRDPEGRYYLDPAQRRAAKARIMIALRRALNE